MERKTSFSAKKIISILKSEHHEYPIGMLVNELGIILNQEGDKDSEIENFLLSLLNDRDKIHRAIAFWRLSDNKDVADRNSEKLLEFQKRPENKDVMILLDGLLGNQ